MPPTYQKTPFIKYIFFIICAQTIFICLPCRCTVGAQDRTLSSEQGNKSKSKSKSMSSHLYDLAVELDEREKYLYNRQTQNDALGALDESLRRIPKDEQGHAQEMIFHFISRGFKKAQYNLFFTNNRNLRLSFFNALRGSPFTFGPGEIKSLLDKIRDNHEEFDFSSFIEEGWIEFVTKAIDMDQNESIVQGVLEIINGIDTLDDYFMPLYFGYRICAAYPSLQNKFDEAVTKKYLNDLDPDRITRIYNILNKNYWLQAEDKKSWLIRDMARRLFYLPVSDWVRIETAICYSLAKNLADEEQITLMDWLNKMILPIKENPRISNRELVLLSHFLQQGSKDWIISKITAYQALRPYFEKDQPLFIALHQQPDPEYPPPMLILNGESWEYLSLSENLNGSISILANFFALDRQTQWTEELWNVFKKDYYQRYDRAEGLQERLFDTIVKPIYKEASVNNPIRRKLLQDNRIKKGSSGQYLQNSHRYQIAHFIFSKKSMRSPVNTADKTKPTSLEYVVDVYTDLALDDYYQRWSNIYSEDQKAEALLYINKKLDEPLSRLCNAFLGAPDQEWGDVPLSLESDDPEVKQLHRILSKIKEVKKNYALPPLKLEALSNISYNSYQQIEKIIQNNGLNYVNKVVSITKLILKITAILEEDCYLKELIKNIREGIYGLDDMGRFTEPSPKEFQKKLNKAVDIFMDLHPDLFEALQVVNKSILQLFYEKLYVPLRNIRGFFHRVGARPYLDFVKELAQGKAKANDLLNRIEIDQLSLNEFIDGEKAIADLLGEYLRILNINIWEKPNCFPFGRNINLGLIRRLLTKIQIEGWKREKADYPGILSLFISNLQEAEMLQKGIDEAGGKGIYYSPWDDFFVFLRSVLDLYEIHAFPFDKVKPEEIIENYYTIENIEDITLKVPITVTSRSKVAGELRKELYDAFLIFSPLSAENVKELIFLALFFPNQEENNLSFQRPVTKTCEEVLDEYRKIKRQAFNLVLPLLGKSQQSSQRLQWFKWLARLHYSLMDEKLMEKDFLGYIQIKRKYLGHLDANDKKILAFEEFRLSIINKISKNQLDDIEILRKNIYILLEEFYQSFDLPKTYRASDTITRIITKLCKRLKPQDMIVKLVDEQIENLWFLMDEFQEALGALKKSDPNDRELKENFAGITSDVMLLYQFFLPYMHSEFTIDVILESENALAAFSMLKAAIKEKLFDTMKIYNYQEVCQKKSKMPQEYLKQGEKPPLDLLSSAEIYFFLMTHNFLPISILERCLEDPNIFIKLVEGKKIKVVHYNFKILARREKEVTVSTEDLMAEVLGGVNLNKKMITDGKVLSDQEHLQYYFGDMRKLFNRDIIPEAVKMPQNFDHILKKMIMISHSNKYQNLVLKLSKEYGESKITKRAKELPRRIDEILEKEAYNYFGRVLVEHFSSPFTIQKACELAQENITQAKEKMKNDEYKSYSHFYITSLFDNDQFRYELLKILVQKFYPGLNNKESRLAYRKRKQDDFFLLIDGHPTYETKGLKECLNNRSEFAKKYQNSFFDLFPSLFKGKYLEDNKIFIGDLIWCETDEQGQRKMCPLETKDEKDKVHVYELLNWIYLGSQKYAAYPRIKKIFVDQKPASFYKQAKEAMDLYLTRETDESLDNIDAIEQGMADFDKESSISRLVSNNEKYEYKGLDNVLSLMKFQYDHNHTMEDWAKKDDQTVKDRRKFFHDFDMETRLVTELMKRRKLTFPYNGVFWPPFSTWSGLALKSDIPSALGFDFNIKDLKKDDELFQMYTLFSFCRKYTSRDYYPARGCYPLLAEYKSLGPASEPLNDDLALWLKKQTGFSIKPSLWNGYVKEGIVERRLCPYSYSYVNIDSLPPTEECPLADNIVRNSIYTRGKLLNNIGFGDFYQQKLKVFEALVEEILVMHYRDTKDMQPYWSLYSFIGQTFPYISAFKLTEGPSSGWSFIEGYEGDYPAQGIFGDSVMGSAHRLVQALWEKEKSQAIKHKVFSPIFLLQQKSLVPEAQNFKDQFIDIKVGFKGFYDYYKDLN